MNILRDFTLKNIKLNKKRSIVTIIGIILSTALICTVAGMFYSFDQTMINTTIKADGDYHVALLNVKKEDLKYYENNPHIKKYSYEHILGMFKTGYDNYLSLTEYDENSLASLSLESGRLPENGNEIVISDKKYKVGDEIEIEYGEIFVDDYETSLINTLTKKYKVVGILSDDCIRYEYITKMENINDVVNVKIKYDNIKKTYKYTNEIKKDYEVSYHTELLNWNFVTRGGSTSKAFIRILLVVILIIMISSIFVIRNSFEISITEKMRQYGMLSSIGATKKQIVKTVLYEGLFLGIVAIPIGIIIGYLVIHILVLFTNVMFDGIINEQIKFVVHIPLIAILISIITGSLTIFFSSLKSAYKASKVSPIEAIRNNNEIKIKSKKLRTPKIINKLFGMGGVIAYKNLKRNKKKYRTTVISLVVSITIFIALYSFMNNIFNVSGLFYKEMHFNMSINGHFDSNEEKLKIYDRISKLDGVDKYMIYEYKIAYLGEKNIQLYAIDNNSYKNFLNDLNLNYENTKDKLIYVENNNLNNNVNDYSFKENDILKIQANDLYYDIEVAKITGKNNYDLDNLDLRGVFVVSEEYLNSIDDKLYVGELLINSDDAYKLEEEIERLNIENLSITNYSKEAKEINGIFTWMSVFLYGFIIVISLIGVTNIFNTITTNMNLRSKEFAMLKSVGMTKKEFNNMIRFESILYGLKSLLIGCTLGTILSYLIYSSLNDAIGLKYVFPIKAIIISIIFISLVIGLIMKYSLSKINKQNIIETIRRDNI